ncbi:transporter substrate-binding domain-containing protein [Pseudomonas sp.]|uniref:substrate-binding periplasmic protein n=1 Tax=Pseudomonas sp. TaxID=306 RepID=UPI00299E16C2|nr:transporter substrate-binding domain-containing protein [Pseudomonas sp.]MDX1367080.1 transporter substrate-binding domain-containing protein [Pseudomonas sp.]
MDTELTGTLARLLLALVLGLVAPALRAETLIAIDNANPPFMYQQDGQARGLYPLVLHAVFARVGQPLAIQAMPWKRALRRSENAEVGVGGIYKTSRRMALYDYSQPIFEEKLIVFVHRDKAFRFTQVDDLYGKRIGVIRGWSYTEALDEAIRDGSIQVTESSSDKANFKMLASGRLDAVIAIELAGQRIIQQLQMHQVLALAPPLSINPTYLVFAKQARQQALLQRFDQILLEMRADGSLDKLVQQAMGSE